MKIFPVRMWKRREQSHIIKLKVKSKIVLWCQNNMVAACKSTQMNILTIKMIYHPIVTIITHNMTVPAIITKSTLKVAIISTMVRRTGTILKAAKMIMSQINLTVELLISLTRLMCIILPTAMSIVSMAAKDAPMANCQRRTNACVRVTRR